MFLQQCPKNKMLETKDYNDDIRRYNILDNIYLTGFSKDAGKNWPTFTVSVRYLQVDRSKTLGTLVFFLSPLSSFSLSLLFGVNFVFWAL